MYNAYQMRFLWSYNIIPLYDPCIDSLHFSFCSCFPKHFQILSQSHHHTYGRYLSSNFRSWP